MLVLAASGVVGQIAVRAGAAGRGPGGSGGAFARGLERCMELGLTRSVRLGDHEDLAGALARRRRGASTW